MINKKKAVLLVLIAILITLLAYDMASRELRVNNTDLCVYNGTSCTGSRLMETNYTASVQTYVIILCEVSGANKAMDLEFYIDGTRVVDHDHQTGSLVVDIDDDFHFMVPRGSVYNASHVGTTATIDDTKWYEYKWE